MDTIYNTGIVRDFNKTGKLPSVDQLLDWRLLCKYRKENNGQFTQEWYTTQIQATDYLLDKHLK